MAEKVEEIAELLETLKNESEQNAEGLNNLLFDIKLKLENINGDNVEITSVIEDLRRSLDAKISGDEQKLMVISDRLLQVSSALEYNSELSVKIDTLSLNLKDAASSIVKFANEDAGSKNILFEKVSALENSINKDDTRDVVLDKYNELAKYFENFTADANLRNGNLISAIADIIHTINDNSSKNTYMINSLSGNINENTEKLADLEGTVNAQLGTVNSKLFSLGDDIQNTLTDGFEHLKYLSANLSDHMNSNSIDMKTSLECIRANLSDYSEQIKAGLEDFNKDFGFKIEDSSNIQSKNSQLVLDDLKQLSAKFDEQSKEYENSLNKGMAKVYEFLTAYRDAVLSINDDNKEILASKFSDFETNLANSYNEYKNIANSMRVKLEDAASLIRETADSVVLGVVNSNSEIINELKTELLVSSGKNLDSIISKIDETAQNLTSFKDSVAENLSDYLSSIKELFVDYSESMSSLMKDEEIIAKLEKVEDLIAASTDEGNKNFNFIMSGFETSNESLQELAGFVKNAHSEQAESLDEIKTLIVNSSESEKTISHLENIINEHSADKNEKIESLRTILEGYKQSVDKLTDDFAVQNGNTTFDLSVLKKFTHEVLPKFNKLHNLEEIISSRTNDFKDFMNSEVKDIHGSLSKIIEVVSSLPVEDNAEIVSKLLDFEVQLNEASQTYEQNLESLKVVLNNYTENSEKINVETDVKLQTSIAEIQKMQGNFDILAGKMSTLIGDSGLIEILANIRQQFNVVLTQLKNEREELVLELNDNLSDGIGSISSNLYLIGQNLEEVRVKQSENAEYLRGNFEEKMLGLQADIENTVSDIKNVIDFKSGIVLESFQPVKEAINTLVEFDYEQIISDVKNQVELSYINISESLKLLSEQSASFDLIDGLYKEAISKLDSFEQQVRDIAQTNFDVVNQTLLNISTLIQGTFTISENVQSILETDLKRIENNLLETREYVKVSLVEMLEDIKQFISERSSVDTDELRTAFLPLLDNDELFNLIKGLNKNLADKMEEFRQDHTLAAQDILDIVNSVNNTVDYTLDVINEKFEIAVNNRQELVQKIDALNSKIDIIAMDENTELADSIAEIGDAVVSVKDMVSDVSYLVNEINTNTASGSSIIPAIRMSVEKIRETIADAGEKLKVNEDYEKILNDINLKLDALTADGSDSINIQLNEIKNVLGGLSANIENVFAVNDLVKVIDNKLDIIAMDDEAELLEALQELKDEVKAAYADNSNTEKLEHLIQIINDKVDIIAQASDVEFEADINEIKKTLTAIEEKTDSSVITDLIRKIDNKLDVIVQDNNSELEAGVEDIKNSLSIIEDKVDSSALKDLIHTIDNKLDVIVQDDNSELEAGVEDIKNSLSVIEDKVDSSALKDLIHTIDNKLDVIVQDDNSELEAGVEDIKNSLSIIEDKVDSSALKDLIHTIDNKLDVIVQDDNSKLEADVEDIQNLINNISNKLDVIASSDNVEIVEGLEQVAQQIGALQNDIQNASNSGFKLEDLINTLHNKIDVLAMSDDSNIQDEISEIRDLIEEQISKDNNNNVNESLQRLLGEISSIDLSKQTGEIKDSVISAIVAVANDISFVEETEEIKDFVNERTNELHRTMMDVKHQLSTLTSSADDMDFYSYTLQDVESDLAKLRLILKDMSGESSANEICVMSNNILKISKTLESLRDAFYEAEARRLSSVDVNEQVVSISARLNQLILNKKEVDEHILARLTDNANKLDNMDTSDVTKGIEKVLVSMDEKLAYSNNLNTILKNVMMYLGEWMDGTTETISSIYDKTAKINSVVSVIEDLKKSVPEKRELINVLENKFNEQDLRIARLEEQLTRISGLITSKNDSVMLDRIDRIDNRLERLSENIEKLASYVE